ncbi:glutathione S-transferase C-terminal domain-containing protein [Carnimonas bestiolae]|uniref:glutathione S-transferase C-terminal domain-containing protein n=1 Tax=Carnimonas bestiolae TaxID=3402172 RepID=UPI003EDB700F
MIDLYYWTTPNGHKLTIALEELGLEYRLLPINIGRGEQFTPEFLAVAPNNRIPALVDHNAEGEPLALFESGAMLEYLADKTGKLLPTKGSARYVTLQWLYWQMAGLGPMAGQNHHFRNYSEEKIPYAIERYVDETARLYRVLDTRLRDVAYVGGDDYSIADIAIWPWIKPYEAQGQRLEDFPNLAEWFERIGERDAVKRAYALVESVNPDDGKPMDEEARRHLFKGR